MVWDKLWLIYEGRWPSRTRIGYTWTTLGAEMFNAGSGPTSSHLGQVQLWSENPHSSQSNQPQFNAVPCFSSLNVFLIVDLQMCHFSEVKWDTGTLLIQYLLQWIGSKIVHPKLWYDIEKCNSRVHCNLVRSMKYSHSVLQMECNVDYKYIFKLDKFMKCTLKVVPSIQFYQTFFYQKCVCFVY